MGPFQKFIQFCIRHLCATENQESKEHLCLMVNDLHRCEINKREYLRKKAVKNGNENRFQAYKIKRNEVNELIKSAKLQY